MAAASQAALPVTTCPAARRDLERNLHYEAVRVEGWGGTDAPWLR